MTPADERVLQLLQKWQKSLDLHTRYADLPEDKYWLVQPWPKHQRPTKWVIDLARQRSLTLIAVSNEVGMGVVPPYPSGHVFRELLGRVNQVWAARADQVYLMVAGIPMVVK